MQLVLTVADVAAQMLTSVGSNPEVATGRFVVRSAPRIIAAPSVPGLKSAERDIGLIGLTTGLRDFVLCGCLTGLKQHPHAPDDRHDACYPCNQTA
jgi:hypothetical protein